MELLFFPPDRLTGDAAGYLSSPERSPRPFYPPFDDVYYEGGGGGVRGGGGASGRDSQANSRAGSVTPVVEDESR